VLVGRDVQLYSAYKRHRPCCRARSVVFLIDCKAGRFPTAKRGTCELTSAVTSASIATNIRYSEGQAQLSSPLASIIDMPASEWTFGELSRIFQTHQFGVDED